MNSCMNQVVDAYMYGYTKHTDDFNITIHTITQFNWSGYIIQNVYTYEVNLLS